MGRPCLSCAVNTTEPKVFFDLWTACTSYLESCKQSWMAGADLHSLQGFPSVTRQYPVLEAFDHPDLVKTYAISHTGDSRATFRSTTHLRRRQAPPVSVYAMAPSGAPRCPNTHAPAPHRTVLHSPAPRDTASRITRLRYSTTHLREPGAPARGGRGVLPRGCSESPARPMGGHLLQRTGRTGLGGRGVLPRGCSEPPARPMGGHLLQRTGRTGPGGTGSPAQGVFGVSCQAKGGPSSSENRAHRPGGDGESCPGGVRSLLPSQWGAIFFREPGAPARGGDGESCPGGVRSLLPGQWGAIFF